MESIILDKSKFKKSKKILSLTVDIKKINELMKLFKSDLIHQKLIRPVQLIPNDKSKKRVLLRHCTISKLSTQQVEFIKQNQILVQETEIQIGYEQLSFNEVLQSILPKNLEIVRSFEQIGHIVHLNLTDAHQKYKKVIGQVILDKIRTVKTVVTKVGAISNQFRVLPFELLCGENNYFVDIKEHGIRFKFDFSKVYWNSRLSGEHQRITGFIQNSNEIVFDMFAGVGPFVIPIAKFKQCKCFANDLNPESFKYLKLNCTLNKVNKNVECFNMDGKNFLRMMVRERKVVPSYIIMNLPASAMDFLIVLKGLFEKGSKSPIIHCYCFEFVKKGEDVSNLLKEKVGNIFDSKKIEFIKIHDVRDVSSYKKMFCITFRLPQKVIWRKKRKFDECDDENIEENPKKKLKT